MVQVGFIGTGKRPEKPGLEGWGMAYRHADGYAEVNEAKLVACADIAEDNAKAFAVEFGLERTYTDYREMLDAEDLDIVHICTWPKLHAPISLDCMRAGTPMVYCEKPMAVTFGQCRELVKTAEETGCRLRYNHQRRFGLPLMKTKDLIQQGAIGELQRMESSGNDMFDQGVNWVDLLNFFNDDHDVEWVIGQADAREVLNAFGVPVEYQAICHFRYTNGVQALMVTGNHLFESAPPFRLIGSEGMLELGWKLPDAPALRYLRDGEAGWIAVDCGEETVHSPMRNHLRRTMAHLVANLGSDEVSPLDYHNEYRSMEVLFGFYESVRRRGRVDLPLNIDDSPFQAMLDSGEIGPASG